VDAGLVTTDELQKHGSDWATLIIIQEDDASNQLRLCGTSEVEGNLSIPGRYRSSVL
jgi:hypothetical protein